MKNERPLPHGTRLLSLQAQKVFTGVRFNIYQWQQTQFDASVATYEVAQRDDTVVVIPVVGEEVVIVKEQQPHWEKPGFTLVAGMVRPNEDLEVAARRELEEETGMVFKRFDLVAMDHPMPGIEWFVYTFIASDFERVQNKSLDAGEKNEIIKINFDQLITMTRHKEFVYRPRLVEDYIIEDKLKDLSDLLTHPSKYSLSSGR